MPVQSPRWPTRRGIFTRCSSIPRSRTRGRVRRFSRVSPTRSAVAAIRAQVGDEEVILGLSGGVDSSVAAALIHEAIGDQLTCVFVDHGLLRLNEAEQVRDTFARNLGVRVIHIDATDEMYHALAGVDDPEKKRNCRRLNGSHRGRSIPT